MVLFGAVGPQNWARGCFAGASRGSGRRLRRGSAAGCTLYSRRGVSRPRVRSRFAPRCVAARSGDTLDKLDVRVPRYGNVLPPIRVESTSQTWLHSRCWPHSRDPFLTQSTRGAFFPLLFFASVLELGLEVPSGGMGSSSDDESNGTAFENFINGAKARPIPGIALTPTS
jgi:hypothetical protein